MSLLDDEYLSSFFWQEPCSSRAGKAKRVKFQAQTWFLERRLSNVFDHLIDCIYLMRCQLMHGREETIQLHNNPPWRDRAAADRQAGDV